MAIVEQVRVPGGMVDVALVTTLWVHTISEGYAEVSKESQNRFQEMSVAEQSRMEFLFENTTLFRGSANCQPHAPSSGVNRLISQLDLSQNKLVYPN